MVNYNFTLTTKYFYGDKIKCDGKSWTGERERGIINSCNPQVLNFEVEIELLGRLKHRY
jgi:hypothetical protein